MSGRDSDNYEHGGEVANLQFGPGGLNVQGLQPRYQDSLDEGTVMISTVLKW